MSETNNKLAVVGGNGDLTIHLAKSAKEKGFNIYGVALTKEAKENLKSLCEKLYCFSPGEVSSMLKVLKEEKIKQVVFIGKVPKLELLRNVYKLDLLAIKYISTLRNLNHDSINLKVANVLKNEYDVSVLPQAMFLKSLFQEKKVLSKRTPSKEEQEDIEFGFEIAKHIASIDIGQTVIVKNKMIIAIEAIEGTDEAIKRGCKLAKSEIVVVKVAKPEQDDRFDVPTIGANTIKTLAKNGGGILAFESNKTILVDKEKTINAANKYKICLIAV